MFLFCHTLADFQDKMTIAYFYTEKLVQRDSCGFILKREKVKVFYSADYSYIELITQNRKWWKLCQYLDLFLLYAEPLQCTWTHNYSACESVSSAASWVLNMSRSTANHGLLSNKSDSDQSQHWTSAVPVHESENTYILASGMWACIYSKRFMYE
jgi:hypothetical protein